MLLLLASLLLLGLVPTADRPGAPGCDRPASAAAPRTPALRPDAPAPRRPAHAARVWLRAHAPERDTDPSRPSAVADTLAPPHSARPWRRGSSCAAPPSAAALVYAFCTLLC